MSERAVQLTDRGHNICMVVFMAVLITGIVGGLVFGLIGLAVPAFGCVGMGICTLLFQVFRQLGWFKWVNCHMGWHSPSRMWVSAGNDGSSDHAVCPWCGYAGMIDSQGNLF